MMFFDLRTTLLIAGLMSGLMASVLLAAHYSFPKSVGGLKAWAVANVYMLLAGLGFSERGIIPDFLSIIVANLFLLCGYWLMLSATRALMDLPKLSARPALLLLGLIAVLLWFWTYVQPSFAARSLLISSIVGCYYAVQAISLWRWHRRGPESYLFILLMSLGFAVTLARTVSGAIHFHTDNQSALFTPSVIQSLYLTTFTLLSLFHSMAFFFLATRKLQNELQKLARNDPLTGIFNRRGMMEFAESFVNHASRKGLPISAIVCDLDQFKLINDTYGHDVGDAVLCDFTGVVNALKRTTDIFARLGGEEFALILQDTNQAQAIVMANRILAQLNSQQRDCPQYTSDLPGYFRTI
jgi:diguanylate cyclase (GGDEF)-like protein